MREGGLLVLCIGAQRATNVFIVPHCSKLFTWFMLEPMCPVVLANIFIFHAHLLRKRQLERNVRHLMVYEIRRIPPMFVNS